MDDTILPPGTLFCDIDGTLIRHNNDPIFDASKAGEPIKENVEWLHARQREGYLVVLTTGRPESLRKMTEKMLLKSNINYDVLLMGIGRGPRYIINDQKPNGAATAIAINQPRNGSIQQELERTKAEGKAGIWRTNETFQKFGSIQDSI